jgi:methylase of polypeptide subunit release factors
MRLLAHGADVRDALQDLDAFVRAAGYLALERYPSPGEAKHLYNDPGNLLRYLLHGSNAWRASALASTYYRRLAGTRPDLSVLHDAFMLARPVAVARFHALASPERCERWRDAGLLSSEAGTYVSTVRGTPWQGRLFWHDAPPGFRESWVFLGPDSLRLARRLERSLRGPGHDRPRRALDLGTGAGILAISLAPVSDEVVGVDINPRAIDYARLNAGLNGARNVVFHISDLFDAVAGERFDLIVSNPPFLFLPPEWRARCVDGDGGALGMALTLRIVDGLPAHLTADGRAVLQANAPVVDGRDLLVEELRARLGDRPWRVRLTPLHEFQDETFLDFYAAHRIERFVAYVIEIERADRFALVRTTMSPWRRTACAVRIAAVRARHRRRRAAGPA